MSPEGPDGTRRARPYLGTPSVDDAMCDRPGPTHMMTIAQDARLEMAAGPQCGQTFSLDQGSLVLGRDPRSGIVIDHPQISRRHARFIQRGEGWVVEDLGSTNGTFLNGAHIVTPQRLTDGDVIGLSDAFLLTFRAERRGTDKARQACGEDSPTLRSPESSEQQPAGGVIAISRGQAPASMPKKARVANIRRRHGSQDSLTWIWMAIAFLVLSTIAVTALLLILRYLGALSHSLLTSTAVPSSMAMRWLAGWSVTKVGV